MGCNMERGPNLAIATLSPPGDGKFPKWGGEYCIVVRAEYANLRPRRLETKYFEQPFYVMLGNDLTLRVSRCGLDGPVRIADEAEGDGAMAMEDISIPGNGTRRYRSQLGSWERIHCWDSKLTDETQLWKRNEVAHQAREDIHCRWNEEEQMMGRLEVVPPEWIHRPRGLNHFAPVPYPSSNQRCPTAPVSSYSNAKVPRAHTSP